MKCQRKEWRTTQIDSDASYRGLVDRCPIAKARQHSKRGISTEHLKIDGVAGVYPSGMINRWPAVTVLSQIHSAGCMHGLIHGQCFSCMTCSCDFQLSHASILCNFPTVSNIPKLVK